MESVAPQEADWTVGRWWHTLRYMARLVALSTLLVVGVLVGFIYLESRRDEARPADAIVVLGTAQYNGRPSPVLRARLDHALALYRRGIAPLIITTGGRGRDPRFSEGGVGRDYLIAHGVPPGAVLAEEEGASSWESLQNAARLLAGRDVRRIVLVSDPFHMARLKLMARDLGFEPLASPTRTSPISRSPAREFFYVLREMGGIVVYLFSSPRLIVERKR